MTQAKGGIALPGNQSINLRSPESDLTCPTLELRKVPPLIVPERFPSRLPVGSVLDDQYEVESHVGSGGFADVYRALDRSNGRPVAIKVLRFLGGPELQKNVEARFIQDARAAASISHPNVVRILSFHESMSMSRPGGQVASYRRMYIAMEFLEGLTLKQFLADNGPIELDKGLALMLGALDGLALGHNRRIVHKDLKPANLFVTQRGDLERLTVLDFGVARLTDGRGLTNPGDHFCTPRYAAPEYLKDGSATPALDVYQMGLVLAEMLTGVPVVAGTSFFDCGSAHQRGLDIDPRLKRSVIGPVLERALAKDPVDRYVDARAFHTALKWRIQHIV